MDYLENTKKVKHDLNQAQINFLRKTLDEIDSAMFDMSGRPLSEDYDFIFECFRSAVEIETKFKEVDIQAFKAFRYFRSIVCNFEERKVLEEYKLMIKSFQYASSVFIETLKNNKISAQ